MGELKGRGRDETERGRERKGERRRESRRGKKSKNTPLCQFLPTPL